MLTDDERVFEQRMTALGRANQIRTARSLFRIAIRNHSDNYFPIDLDRENQRRITGAESVIDLIEDPPDWATTWQVQYALKAIPWVGLSTIRRWLNEARIPAARQLGRLTEHQRADLVRSLRTWTEKWAPDRYYRRDEVAEPGGAAT